MNLADVLHRSADAHPERPAVTDVRSGRSVTYGQLARDAARLTAWLAARGVARHQRIALRADNGPEYLAAAFAILASGAALVPIATNLTESETAQVLHDVDVNGLVSRPDSEFVFEWIDRAADAPPELAALDPAFIRFTSGTTDRSKGVVLSHQATADRVVAADRVLRFTADDRILWVLPLAYHFAVTIVAYVKAGAHIVMCGDTRPRALLDALRRFDPSVIYASPFHIESLGNLPRSGPLKSVRLALSTSAPIAGAVMERFERVYDVPVAQAYGIIEVGLPCINTRTDGVPAASVGRAVPGYDIAVFSDDGSPVAAGSSGEIGVRGSGLFSAYYAPWQRRERVTRDGWFLTGDVGRLDETGALYLEGRKKAVIFVAGLKFFPEEVEACINRFPGIRESRVFGAAHPRLGQVPRAEIVLAATACDLNALRAHCARALSPYKVPLDFTVVPAIARTPGGKILRR